MYCLSEQLKSTLFNFIIFIGVSIGFENRVDNTISAIEYLSKYGHLPQTLHNSSRMLDIQSFSTGLSDFQRLAGLPITGIFDKITRETMNRPRCGVTNNHKHNGGDYVLAGKWEKRHITYKVFQYSRKMKVHEVDSIISKAFGMWSKYIDITFTPSTSNRVDIEIRFTPYGTYQSQFDGRGGTLAFAYFPPLGDIYFDESEPWTVDTSGRSLYYVAVHEIGHALGLDHTRRRDAAMYAFYNDGYQNLSSDDIAGIQRLYGRKNTVHPEFPENTPKHDPEINPENYPQNNPENYPENYPESYPRDPKFTPQTPNRRYPWYNPGRVFCFFGQYLCYSIL